MTYIKKDIYKKAVKAIKMNKLFFVEDVVALLPCDKTTFYRFFPVNCNEYNAIKDLLDNEKINIKIGIRQKLFKGDHSADLIALYKLICTDDERRALSMQQIDITAKGNTVMGIEYIIPDENKDQTNE